MAFIPIPNTIKLTFEYTIGGKPVVNVSFFEKASAVTLTDLQDITDIADAWDVAFNADFRSVGMLLERFTATDETEQDGLAFIKTLTTPRAGTAGGALNPNNVAACLSLRTGLRGRSFRGRQYIGGQLETNNIGDVINPDYIADALDVFGELQDAMLTGGFTWVVASRYSGGAPRITGVTTPITEIRMNDRIDTQRRRLD